MIKAALILLREELRSYLASKGDTTDVVLENIALLETKDAENLDQRIVISLVNIDPKNAQDVELDITGGKYNSMTGRILTSEKLQDHNTFENPEKVKPAAFKGAQLKGNTLTIKLPPFSVVVLELK